MSAVSRDQKILAAGTNKGRLCLWDLTGPAPELAAVLEGHRLPVKALDFAADGTALASAGADGKVILWDMEAGELRQRAALQHKQGEVTVLAFAPDGKRIVTGTQQGAVLLGRRAATGTASRSSCRFREPGSSAWRSRRMGELACGCRDQSLVLIDVQEEAMIPRKHAGPWKGVVRAVQYHPEGHSLDTLEDGGRKCVWQHGEETPLETWMVPFVQVYSHAMTFDGRYLATGSSDGKMVVYRVAPKRPRAGSNRPESS